MRNTQSKTKLIKTRKKIGRPSCLACYDCTDNFKSEEIKMTNRVLREKSNCVHLVNQDLKKTTLQQKIIQLQHKLPSFFKLQKHAYVL